MRIHNILIGGATFWGALVYGVHGVPSIDGGKVVEVPDFTERWGQSTFSNPCTRQRYTFHCDFVMAASEQVFAKPPRLYVSRNPSYFSRKVLGLDH